MIEATYVDHMGTDLSVVNAARVSFSKNSSWNGVKGVLKQGDLKLINYLAEHKHISPFGHCFMSFHCKAPIFVARQLVKHKFLRWNEVSRRYIDSRPEFYTPDTWRGKSSDKKQGSDGVVDPNYNPQYLDDSIKHAYLKALDAGVCPEQARMLLPQSTITEWYWSGSLDAFADMCNLRLKTDTQAETRTIAQDIDNIALGLYPASWQALLKETKC